MKNLLNQLHYAATALCFFFCSSTVWAQQKMELEIWPDGAPNTNNITEPEQILEGMRIGRISRPTLTVYLPEKSCGKAIIACPGGGYTYVATRHEGHDMAQWFNEQGIAFAVLKYRTPNGHYDVPLTDALEAIRLLRRNAEKWNIRQVGIMGASAGGHLASTAATHYTADSRPDFQLLFYPVVSMQKGVTHSGSRQQLLGRQPSDELIRHFSNELHVDSLTPPALIIHCSDDAAVRPENSLRYYKALIAHRVPATLICYPKGGHGWGFSDSFPYKKEWMAEVRKWLEML